MQRIFIISPHPVFSQGVEALLSRETGFQVIGKDTSVDRATESIKQLHPDVILVDYDKSVIARLLEEKIGPRVISLDLYSNNLSIYRTEECVVHQVDDLIKLIADDALEVQSEIANANAIPAADTLALPEAERKVTDSQSMPISSNDVTTV